MTHALVRRITFSAFVAACCFLYLIVLPLLAVPAAAQPTASTATRAEDPVLLMATALAAVEGEPIEELRLYRNEEGVWSPLPFQVDEVTASGAYTTYEDGVLDDNDELLFMFKDAGDAAGEAWPEDEMARSHPRLAIQVSDPLGNDADRWVYLFRSTTLTSSVESYVAWDEAAQTIMAISYTASFTQSFVGLADLTIHGNETDILDRQKIRVTAFGGVIRLDEENLAEYITPTLSLPVVGPVRGVSGGEALNVEIYGARFDSYASFDTSDIPFNLDSFRSSFDLNDSALTGITHYYDSLGHAFAIDGEPDTLEESSLMGWYQASGDAGGIFVALPTVEAGGTVQSYYKDDDTLDPADTGDQRSYGDTGLLIQNPGTTIEVGLSTFILPPGTTENVGAAYAERLQNPLVATTTVEQYGEEEPPQQLFLPTVLSP